MLKIRLRRMGSRHRPHYRVVVSDSRRAPTSSAVEEIGFYDPRKNPKLLKIDLERVQYWQGHGAQLSDTVRKLVRHAKRQPVEAVNDAEAVQAKAEKTKPEKKTETAAKKAEEAPKVEETKAEEAPKVEETKAEEAPKAEETKAEAAPEAEADKAEAKADGDEAKDS